MSCDAFVCVCVRACVRVCVSVILRMPTGASKLFVTIQLDVRIKYVAVTTADTTTGKTERVERDTDTRTEVPLHHFSSQGNTNNTPSFYKNANYWCFIRPNVLYLARGGGGGG